MIRNIFVASISKDDLEPPAHVGKSSQIIPYFFWGPKETKKMLGELIPVMLQPGLSEWWGRGGSSVIPDVLPVCTQDFYLVLVHFYPKNLPDILPLCPLRFLPDPCSFLPRPRLSAGKSSFSEWWGEFEGTVSPIIYHMGIIKHINWLGSLHSYLCLCLCFC